VEAGETGLIGEELLHGGLFEPLFLAISWSKPIHVVQRRCDGALFRPVG